MAFLKFKEADPNGTNLKNDKLKMKRLFFRDEKTSYRDVCFRSGILSLSFFKLAPLGQTFSIQRLDRVAGTLISLLSSSCCFESS